VTTTVWGVATKVGGTSAHYDRLGYLTGAHAYRSLALELPGDGVIIDCDHDHVEVGRLLYAELGEDEALRCVAVVDGDLTRAEEPVYFSPELELRGDVDKSICVAREAAMLGLSLTFSPATIGASPVRVRAGDLRNRVDRGKWSFAWRTNDSLLARALDYLGDGYRVEQRSATQIVDMRPRRAPSLAFAARTPARIETRAASTVDVSTQTRTIELVCVPYGKPAVVDYRGRMIEETISNRAFARVEQQPNIERIRANRDHDPRRVFGRCVNISPFHVDGLHAAIKVSRTTLGDESIELARDGLLDSSIGFAVEPDGEVWESRNRRRVTSAYLDHVALVANPAYADARIVGVRDSRLLAGV